MLVYQRVAPLKRPCNDFTFRRTAMRFVFLQFIQIQVINSSKDKYKVVPPRWLSWFITLITMVYGTYNYTYWGL